MYKGAEAEDNPPVGETPGKSWRELKDHNNNENAHNSNFVHHGQREKQWSKNATKNPVRKFGSVKSHWGILRKSVNKFQGLINQVEQFNQRSASAEDQLNQELRIYSEDQKTSFKHPSGTIMCKTTEKGGFDQIVGGRETCSKPEQ
ncbi:hypothetical protein VP01_7441g1 [Puccinia sorghi]|uniref:No apical meristem-associated C-terminal domain-containing protein n=1 Tax=Puccinia sorghi TaxID=27349 RepID=A0A0L6UCF1_9BASI|nr:hypothetical protein VP01_7441g1 [Puccinia sorghi]